MYQRLKFATDGHDLNTVTGFTKGIGRDDSEGLVIWKSWKESTCKIAIGIIGALPQLAI
jgi:hypothetical protein